MRPIFERRLCCNCDSCIRACPVSPSSPEELGEICDGSCGGAACVSACPQSALKLDVGAAVEEGAARESFGWRILGEGECASLQGEVLRLPGLRALGAEEEEFACNVRRAFLDCAGEKSVAECVASLCAEMRVSLDPEQAGLVARFVEIDAGSGGPVALLSGDPRAEEVAVIGVDKPVFVYLSGKGWAAANAAFTSLSALTGAINKLAKPLGRRVTARSPRINAILSNGCRMHASIPPVSGGEITVRRFRSEPFSPADLVSCGAFTAEAMAFLWLATQSDSSIIIAGNTGSGKTSALNALFSFVPLEERVLLIEETPEVRIPHGHACRLVAREELGLGLGELSSDSLRMRPDRVVIGEARDEREVRALFDSMLSGHARGSYATLHARDSRDALARLSSLGVRQADLLALDLIVVLRRAAAFADGRFSESRKCTEISEVADDGGVPRAARLFALDRKSGRLAPRSLGSRAKERICAAFGFGGGELSREISRRARFISSLCARRQGFGECLRELASYGRA